MSFGAVYCVYEDSGFLEESIRRIYGLVDKVVLLVNFAPWNGKVYKDYNKETYLKVSDFFDPLNKIEVVSKFWTTEEEQRNYGLSLLRNAGITHCLIIDDDEMYNYEELKWAFQRANEMPDVACHLVLSQVYWKDRQHAIDITENVSFPFIVKTHGESYFHDNRSVTVLTNKGYRWASFPESRILCHHYSYVRSDEHMLRKIRTFSHAPDVTSDWYSNKWLYWNEDVEDLHPNVENPGSFKRARNIKNFKRTLEPDCLSSDWVKELKQLQYIKIKSKLNVVDEQRKFIEFCYRLIAFLKPRRIFEYKPFLTYYGFAEAIHQYNLNTKMDIDVLEGHYTDVTYPFINENEGEHLYENTYDFVHINKHLEAVKIFAMLDRTKDSYIMLSESMAGNKDLFLELRTEYDYYEVKYMTGFALIKVPKRN